MHSAAIILFSSFWRRPEIAQHDSDPVRSAKIVRARQLSDCRSSATEPQLHSGSQWRGYRWFPKTGLLSAVLVAAIACKPDEYSPTSSTPITTRAIGGTAVAAHISAPQPVSPVSGTELTDSQPTLSVANATVTDDTIVTYRFQVASDDQFGTVVAGAEGVPEERAGRTSWRVSPPLQNQQYFWRARAESQRGVAGPYSTVSDFIAGAVELLVSDSLMNGMSVGDLNGGRFLSQGWQVTRKTDFIRYEVPTLASGYVEWQNTGLTTVNPAPDNFMLFGMWDPSAGPYRQNAFRVHLQKLDANAQAPFLRLRWIANGEQHDTGANIEIWDPGRVYRWRVVWGSGPLGNTVQVFLDDVPIILQQYIREYSPKTHWIELGIEQRRQSVVGAVYSNVRIGRR